MIPPGILDFFPLERIRPVQKQALLEVFTAFQMGKKVVILEAPPGVGKSSLAVALARYYRSAYILTLTKMLQAQYVESFSEIQELKGRSNFACARLEDIAGSCEAGGDRGLCQPGGCAYRLAKAEAVLADVTVCNYMSYLYSVGTTSFNSAALLDPEEVTEDPTRWIRPLLICDEAHVVEEVALEHASVVIDLRKIPLDLDFPLPHPENVEGCFAWLELLSRALEAPGEGLSAKDRKTLRNLRGKVYFALEHRDVERWISEPLSEGRQGFCLKPLTVRSFAARLFQFGERVLLMSATILDAEKMAESLGITDYAYVSVPCPFPVENRSVVVSGLNMTKAHRDRSWPRMVDQIELILENHAAEKGLILTPSNEMLEYILKTLPPGLASRLVLARGRNRMERYQHHLDSKLPTVLAASGFWEGADLKNDYSRFQIIPSIPRPFWSGQVAARGKIDPLWYRLQGCMQLIQGLGRSIRSETDAAVSYVFDVELRREAERYDSLLPQWFRDALVMAS